MPGKDPMEKTCGFVLPYIEQPRSIEIKYDFALIKRSKYKKFIETYPDIPLFFDWMYPFDEDFFRRINFKNS